MKSYRAAWVALLTLFAVLPRLLADYPIVSHRYLADPGAMVHEGRVYVYCSNDDENSTAGGYVMKSIVCVSSSDLKNWTDHEIVFQVPANASWAGNSWAPAAIERDGAFFLYFGNGASGIGVATSASPTGPFVDPLGGSLVNSNTPGVLPAANMWLFDPAVFIDDDGQAYLYFGGNGESNVRIIRLNRDMISTSGSAIALTVPYFFEAAWMHKRNGVYYFSYSTNTPNGLRIDYLTSSSPVSDFVYRGVVAGQPPSNNNNNHAAIFELNGAWYHVYHNRIVATQAGIPTVYRRNIAIEALDYNADGTIRPVAYTTDGVTQAGPLDPYARVEAETMNAQSGVETEPCSEGGLQVHEIDEGDWIRIRGVDFGSSGASVFAARVASAASGGAIELRLGSVSGTLIGTLTVPATGSAQTWSTVTCNVTGATGVQDLYLKFTGSGSSLFKFNWWQFGTAVQPLKVVGAAYEYGANIAHPNGKVYDQILMTGAAATFHADPGQVVRASYIDLNNDIVQVEFSGAGEVTLALDGVTPPALPEKYHQNVSYVKGHATITVVGSDETSNLSVFTVGRMTAVNEALFKDVPYDGVADLARISIIGASNSSGAFGGLRLANVEFWATEGATGIVASGVRFTGPVNAHNISARDQATPMLRTGEIAPRLLGGASLDNAILIAGGDMSQPNGAAIHLDGAAIIYFGAGTDSHGRAQPAQANGGVFRRDGVDVTATVVRGP